MGLLFLPQQRSPHRQQASTSASKIVLSADDPSLGCVPCASVSLGQVLSQHLSFVRWPVVLKQRGTHVRGHLSRNPRRTFALLHVTHVKVFGCGRVF